MDKTSSSVSNVRWVGVSQAGRALIQMASISILARLLAPSDFGLLAMAMVVTGFAGTLRDMGTTAALIQMREARAQVIDAVFWLNIGIGCVLGGLVALSAGWASVIFREPALGPVLALLALRFPVASLGAVQLALMERDCRFREIARVELSSLVVGFGSAAIGALHGFGARSLALQSVVTAVLTTAQVWNCTTWRPRLRWNPIELRSIMGFSGNLVGFGFVNYLTWNADTMLIGRFLGARDLGTYDVAFRTTLLPLNYITGVIGRALFPIYARQNLTELGQYYLKTLSMLAFITSPIALGMWAVRRPFVSVILGDNWMAVADVLTWLGPMAVFECLSASTGVVLTAAGRTGVLRNIGVITSMVYLTAFIVGVHFDIVRVAQGYLAAAAIVFFMAFVVTFRCIGLPLLDLARSIFVPVLAAVVMATAVTATGAWLAASSPPAWMQLAILVPIGAMIYVGLVAAVSPRPLSILRRIAWDGTR